MFLKGSLLRNSKLAALAFFALSLMVVAALIGRHCHGAGFTSTRLAEPTAANESIAFRSSGASITLGQTITSFSISPAAVSGGLSATGVVSLRYPAPAGGIVITLQNGGRAEADMPTQIVIPNGKLSANFLINTKVVRTVVTLNLSASYQTAIETNSFTIRPGAKGQWFVSPDGNRRGQGTQNSPWDLATALVHGPGRVEIRAGDTVWLRAGRYKGTYLSTLSGTENEPIIVRAFPGERVIIDKAAVNDEKQPALKVKGPWVWFWDLEITNSNPNRQRNSPYTNRDQPWRGSGADVYAPNVKFINMIFHDNGHGIWDKQDMTEIHGCLFFYNGNNKREHALYIGNAVGTKYITDNILFAQGGYGILAHSDSLSSSQRGLHIEGNVSFNNGSLTLDDQTSGNLQVGGVRGVAAERVVLKNNYIYNAASNATNKNNGIRLGYEDTSNKDLKLFDNYIVSRVPLRIWWWQTVEFQGNTIHSTEENLDLRFPMGVKPSAYRWDFNSYFSPQPAFRNDFTASGFPQWRNKTGFDSHSEAVTTRRPGKVRIFVRPNKYEAGRANIIVYNWPLLDQVSVDVSSILSPGATFEIRDAQNYLGEALVQGTYRGGPLLLPMNLSRMTLPVGNVERVPDHTAPEFAVFVLHTNPTSLPSSH